jgi:hypothetical protein
MTITFRKKNYTDQMGLYDTILVVLGEITEYRGEIQQLQLMYGTDETEFSDELIIDYNYLKCCLADRQQLLSQLIK